MSEFNEDRHKALMNDIESALETAKFLENELTELQAAKATANTPRQKQAYEQRRLQLLAKLGFELRNATALAERERDLYGKDKDIFG